MSKVALVTGGNRGIGRGITEALLAQGWRVSIMATRPAPADVLAELSTLGEVRYTQGSVADLGDHARYVEETLAQWGRIDALINNAGVAPTERNDLLEATPESYDRVMEVNLRGPYFLTQRVAKAMIDQGAPADGGLTGTIVNVSSISADTISTNRGEYCLSKAGVGMATQLWAVRLAPEGIVVYEVRPGVIATDMTAGVTQKYDAVFASGAVPMPRWGQPSDVGGAVVALTAGLMPYSTGDVITVGGGMQIKTL
ncbi:MAG TPA: 3-ketoacyl-ACP reductase [Propioniciclava sp.]|jgi:NAD(P)-dependent dehydrogenase (short-subunit alcohol dehydrogenase family)|uniref:3-ketoacyl-ACP reductase n=1 Tax=Propioniciclava sp. TaxID=2038686 RepID=UPI002B848DA0|nr:3-ketoacyl-ACP reductase [Propioniciclava sp.]HRL48534.1 3-ketoacyl-ACP reductase [Propioniciclava sp.]HRL79064.1 3-ketoacyl-ACP reductase [Propioniciclava sp.]